MSAYDFPALVGRVANGALLLLQNGHGLIHVQGKDSKRFLHRLSTSSVETAEQGQLFQNMFLTVRGRMADLVWHFVEHEDSHWLISSKSDATSLGEWLKAYHFAEQLEIVEGSPNQLERVLNLISRDRDVILQAYDAYHTIRIAAGLPGVPGEICDSYGPLELGLSRGIDWNKGCYIGQEVISRLESRDKAHTRLCRLKIANEAALRALSSGTTLSRDGIATSPFAVITSIAPLFGETLSNVLAVIRAGSESMPSGTSVIAELGKGQQIQLLLT
jgi:folate-binding protein YgfZ